MATSGDDIRDEDRLPWLETVERERADGPSVWRVIGFVILGLAFIALLVLGVFWIQQHRHGFGGGNGDLIAAQEGDYKVRPVTPGGLDVSSDGSAATATSEGASGGNAAIDVNAVPETPIVGKRAATKPQSAPSPTAVAKVPASGGQLAARAPVAVPQSAASAPRGSTVQLGAYPSQGAANAAWKTMAKRFAYLAPLGTSVEPVQTGGTTLYRLRVNAGSADQASQLCGKLKVAGEACFIAAD